MLSILPVGCRTYADGVCRPYLVIERITFHLVLSCG